MQTYTANYAETPEPHNPLANAHAKALTNPDAERGFLASCVLGLPKPLLTGMEKLNEEHFSTVPHKLIWRTLSTMSADEVDEIAVLLEMSKEAKENCGGDDGILLILGAVETTTHWESFLESIESSYKLRMLHQMALEVCDRTQGHGADWKDIAEGAEGMLMRMARENTSSSFLSAPQVAKLASESIEKQRLGGQTGISIGLPALDSITGGFKPGELVLVAARPSLGKTALALNFLRSVSIDRAGKALLFSMEMNGTLIGERLLPMTARVPKSLYVDGSCDSAQEARWTEAQTKIAGSQFWVDDSSSSTVAKIRARTRNVKSSHGLDILLIDYAQLIGADQNTPSREQEISKISRDLKCLAGDLDIPICLLAQINRQAEIQSRAPRLSDLRESGALEQDADMVLFLHMADPEEPATLDCIVAKNRCGRVGTAKVHFTKSTQRFSEKEQA